MINVLIGIQARSTSTRFPKKIFEEVDGKEVLQHVIDAAKESSLYVNKFTDKNKIFCSVALLIPFGDEPIKAKYSSQNIIIEGPENDVLERYYQAMIKVNADFIVRITSDCPLLPSYLISKHINVCTKNNFDYASNVDPDVRTCPDGHDVEVMSRRALSWANENATTKEDREHVTKILRSNAIPRGFRIAHIIGHVYNPDYKISLDTLDDLITIKDESIKIKECIDKAYKKSGRGSVFRI